MASVNPINLDVEQFLASVSAGGAKAVELRSLEARDEALSLVGRWAVDANSKFVALAADILTAGENDVIGGGLKGVQRYALVAWSETGPMGRKTLVFGRPQEQADGFSENDVSYQGLVAELVRDRRESQKSQVAVLLAVIARQNERENNLLVQTRLAEESRLETMSLLAEFLDDRAARADRRIEVQARANSIKALTDTFSPLILPVLSKLVSSQTGDPVAMAPMEINFLSKAIFSDPTQQIALKLIDAFPEAQKPVVIDLLEGLEKKFVQDKAIEDAQKAADDARAKAIAEEREAAADGIPGAPPIAGSDAANGSIQVRGVQ